MASRSHWKELDHWKMQHVRDFLQTAWKSENLPQRKICEVLRGNVSYSSIFVLENKKSSICQKIRQGQENAVKQLILVAWNWTYKWGRQRCSEALKSLWWELDSSFGRDVWTCLGGKKKGELKATMYSSFNSLPAMLLFY